MTGSILMIVDKGTVNRGELPLDPLLASYGDYWRLSSTGRGDQALVRTAGDEAREIRGARGKRGARPGVLHFASRVGA